MNPLICSLLATVPSSVNRPDAEKEMLAKKYRERINKT
jgi:hypothetical protein